MITLAELRDESNGIANSNPVESSEKSTELAIRIEGRPAVYEFPLVVTLRQPHPIRNHKPSCCPSGARWAVLSCPGNSEAAKFEGEAARFENPTAPETIGPDLISSIRSQSLTEESEGEKDRLNQIGHDGSAKV